MILPHASTCPPTEMCNVVCLQVSQRRKPVNRTRTSENILFQFSQSLIESSVMSYDPIFTSPLNRAGVSDEARTSDKNQNTFGGI